MIQIRDVHCFLKSLWQRLLNLKTRIGIKLFKFVCSRLQSDKGKRINHKKPPKIDGFRIVKMYLLNKISIIQKEGIFCIISCFLCVIRIY